MVATVPGALPAASMLDVRRAQATPGWRLPAAALTTRDPQVLELVWTARQDHAATGDVLYSWVVARAPGSPLVTLGP